VPGANEFEVHRYGDRRLWDEIELAHLRWLSWGRPGQERFGMTVTRNDQRVWLDSPDNVINPV